MNTDSIEFYGYRIDVYIRREDFACHAYISGPDEKPKRIDAADLVSLLTRVGDYVGDNLENEVVPEQGNGSTSP